MPGTRIARLRSRAGLSQAELAARIGVTAAALGAYEQGRRTPSAAILVRLSQTFGVSVDYLLTGEPVTSQDLRAAVMQQLAAPGAEAPRDVLVLRLLLELL